MTDLTNPIFTDADKARDHLEALRWPSGPVCPHCGATDHHVSKVESSGKKTKEAYKGGKHRPARKGLYSCNSCNEQFTVQVGTVLEKSHIPLNKWLAGFYLMCSSKKGYSAHQLHRTLGISYKSAWFMAHRIREAMRAGGLLGPMGGGGEVVEVDETTIGRRKGIPSKRDMRKEDTIRGSTSTKNIVLSLVQRDGSVRSFHVAATTVAELVPIIKANISREAQLMTDEASWYKSLNWDGDFASHDKVNHIRGEYVRYQDIGPVITTNTVEGYFSIFKRGMKGVYQHCSEKHLHRYLAEFDFRYSNRVKLGVDDTERTSRAIRNSIGKRLTYRRTNEV